MPFYPRRPPWEEAITDPLLTGQVPQSPQPTPPSFLRPPTPQGMMDSSYLDRGTQLISQANEIAPQAPGFDYSTLRYGQQIPAPEPKVYPTKAPSAAPRGMMDQTRYLDRGTQWLEAQGFGNNTQAPPAAASSEAPYERPTRDTGLLGLIGASGLFSPSSYSLDSEGFKLADRDNPPQNIPAGPAPPPKTNPAQRAVVEEAGKASGVAATPAARTNNGTSGGDSANPTKPVMREYKPGISWSGQTAADRGTPPAGMQHKIPDSLRQGAYNSPHRLSPAGNRPPFARSADGPGEKTYSGPAWDNYAETSGFQQQIDRGIEAERNDRYDSETIRREEMSEFTDPRRQELRRAKEDAELAGARMKARDPYGTLGIAAQTDAKNESFLRIEAKEKAVLDQKIIMIDSDPTATPQQKAAAIFDETEKHRAKMWWLKNYAPRDTSDPYDDAIAGGPVGVPPVPK